MFSPTSAFTGFSVNDLDQAQAFYSQTLGLKVERQGVGLGLDLPGGGRVFMYHKHDHQPATFTILDFVVDHIDDAVDELTRRGVQFERYPNIPGIDAKG